MAEVQVIFGGNDFMLEKVAYSSADASGVSISIAVSWFSGTAIIGLLAALGISYWNTRKSVNPHLFVRSHVAAYFVSLLWSDLIQAFGSVLNIRWVSMKAVEYGHYCTFQGFIKQSADVSMGIWSLLIAFHTFLVVFLQWNMPKRSLYAFFLGGWGFVLMIIIIGNASYRKEDGPFYGINGNWCWISQNYGNERVTLDYLWLFLSAGLSFVLYTLVYLNLRGNVTMKGIHFKRDQSIKKQVDSESVAIAKQMLMYPVAFTILIFPIAICRFIEWSGHPVSDAASSFSDSVYLMAGLVDVILFALTRRVLPEHSVLPRSVSLKRYLSKRKSAARPNDTNNDNNAPTPDMLTDIPDLEKGDVEKVDENGNPIHVELTDGVFKPADSPDSEHDSENQVTIRVQSVIVDRIYMQPEYHDGHGGHEGPQTLPGLTPRTAGQLEDVPLDNPRGPREQQRTDDYYTKDISATGGNRDDEYRTREIPPVTFSPSSSAPSGFGRGRGSPLDSGRVGAYYTPETAPLPASTRSHGPGFPVVAPSVGDDYYNQRPSSPARSVKDGYYESHPSARGTRDDYYNERIPSPVRISRDDLNNERIPSPARSARDDDFCEQIPTPNARDDPYANDSFAQDASKVFRIPRRSMTEDPRRRSFFDEEPYSAMHPIHRLSPAESSHYTDEGDDEAAPLPSPYTPRTAPLPLYLGTPRSATFPMPNRVPASARDSNFPMSARLPQPSSGWP